MIEGETHKDWENMLKTTKFEMSEWKKIYSKSKTKKEAMEWFWKNYDESAFSLYFVQLDCNKELKSSTLAFNFAANFLQTLTKTKVSRFAFGNLLVLGEDLFQLKGVFLFRGTDKLPPHLDNLSTLKSFKKIDLSDPSQKSLVDNYWCLSEAKYNDLPFDGKSYKVFK